MKNMTVLTRVGNQGQEVYAFQFESDAPVKKEKISISGNCLDTSIDCFLAIQTGRMADGVQDVCWKDGLLTVHVAPFSSQAPYELKIDGETFVKVLKNQPLDGENASAQPSAEAEQVAAEAAAAVAQAVEQDPVVDGDGAAANAAESDAPQTAAGAQTSAGESASSAQDENAGQA